MRQNMPLSVTPTRLPAQLAVAILVVGLSLSFNASAEAPDGHMLYSENCTQCHGTEVYTRTERKVTSRDGLDTQVRLCEQNLGLQWFDDQIESVATLLDKEYYKFGD